MVIILQDGTQALTPAKDSAARHTTSPVPILILSLPTFGNGQREVSLGIYPPFTRTLVTFKGEMVLPSVRLLSLCLYLKGHSKSLGIFFTNPVQEKSTESLGGQLQWVADTLLSQWRPLWTCLLGQTEMTELVLRGSSCYKMSSMPSSNKERMLHLFYYFFLYHLPLFNNPCLAKW